VAVVPAPKSAWAWIRGEKGSPRPLYAFLVALNIVLIAAGLALGREQRIESEAGVATPAGLYRGSGDGPYPSLDGYYWHVAFPESYGPMVHKGVRLYIDGELAGRVAASGFSEGSVWAYYTVDPRFERAMLHSEMEPVHGSGGPRIIVYPKGGGEAPPGCPSEQISAPLA
jgi:hypothetical protein